MVSNAMKGLSEKTKARCLMYRMNPSLIRERLSLHSVVAKMSSHVTTSRFLVLFNPSPMDASFESKS